MSQTRAFDSWLAPGACRIKRDRLRHGGFTLLEILVASVVLSLLVLGLVSITGQSGQAVRAATGKIEASQGARAGFDLLARNLGQATLNTYWRADNPDNPRRYLRSSDLHFVIQQAGVNGIGFPGTGQAVFFQAPLGHTADATSYGGLPSLLNTLGYYVDFRPEDVPALPNAPAPRWRFRLMQMLVPAERMKAFASRDGADPFGWFDPQSYGDFVHPVADNVIALVLRASRPTGEDIPGLGGRFSYDSRLDADSNPQPVSAHQMPSAVEVAMVSIAEESANRLADGSSTPPPVIVSALQGLFSSTASLDDDLGELDKRLSAAGVRFRTYRTSVPILESRWSEN